MTLAPGLGQLAASNGWKEPSMTVQRRFRFGALPCSGSYLIISRNVFAGLGVHDDVRMKRIDEHLPFMAAEELLMEESPVRRSPAAPCADSNGCMGSTRQSSEEKKSSEVSSKRINPLSGCRSIARLGCPAIYRKGWRSTLRYLDQIVANAQPSEDHLTDPRLMSALRGQVIFDQAGKSVFFTKDRFSV